MSSATASKTKTELAGLGFKRAENDRAWDWINDVSANIRGYLKSPAAIMPFLGDDALKKSLAASGQANKMAELVTRLANDTATYAKRYQGIEAKHKGRRGSSTDPDDLLASIMIGQEYIQYMNSYEAVVMASLQEILELFEAAGLDTSSVKPLADGSIVYNLCNQAPSPSAV